MQIAQSLYEGVTIGAQRLGLITYMRTDSTRVAESALAEVRDVHRRRASPGSCPRRPNAYAAGKGAQDAHEAIRPTYVTRTPAELKKHLTSGRVPAVRDHLGAVRLLADDTRRGRSPPPRTSRRTRAAAQRVFRASSTTVVEKGFQKALTRARLRKETTKALPALAARRDAGLRGASTPSSTSPRAPRASPTRRSSRPSRSWASAGRRPTRPIISVLLDRYYVVRKARQLVPTMLGRIINDLLTRSFPDAARPRLHRRDGGEARRGRGAAGRTGRA